MNSSFSWRPLADRFGAEVTLHADGPISTETAAELRRLFDERQVLVFPDQNRSREQLSEFLSIFAPIVDDNEILSNMEDYRSRYLNFWHNELAFHDFPLYALALWGEKVPPGCAGTVFLSGRNAYLDLSEQDRARLEPLVVLNARRPGSNTNDFRFKEIPGDAYCARHPLINTNPRTGEKVLFYNPAFAHSIEGLSNEESAEIFALCEKWMYAKPEVILHRWKPHDLVVWDNFATQHAREDVEHTRDNPTGRSLWRFTLGDVRSSHRFWKHVSAGLKFAPAASS